MSTEVSVAFNDNVQGVWLNSDKNSDVHVYSGKLDGIQPGVVIGTNKSYSDDVDFTDIAVVFKHGEVSLQYNDKGTPKVVVVDPKVAHCLLLNFLYSVKGFAVND